MQKHDDFLPVVRGAGGIAHDQGCHKELQLLDWHMRVHPVRSGLGREIVGPTFAQFQQRHRNARDAILSVGGYLPVPVDERLGVEPVCQFDRKPLARIERQALPAVGAREPEDLDGSAIDVEHPARCGEGHGVLRPAGHRHGEDSRGGDARCEKAAAREPARV